MSVSALGVTPAAPGHDPVLAADVRYTGLVTRAIAFAIDAAVIDAVAVVVAACAALTVSVFHLPANVKTVIVAIGAAAYLLWSIGYFVGFWSTTGQTPGNRVMQFRVVSSKGARLTSRRALVRCVGLLLAALPAFAGYFLILFDRKRRGLHDRLARTVVVEAPALSVADTSRRRRRRCATPELATPETTDVTRRWAR